MKTLFRSILVAALALLAIPAFAAPTAPVFSTLSAALSATQTSVTLASTSGMSASTTTGVPNTFFLLVDAEIMKVTAIPVSGTLTVQRAQDGTKATYHASGVYAVEGFFAANQWTPNVSGSPTFGVFMDKGTYPQGACSRTVQQYSPFFIIGAAGVTSTGPASARAGDCVGGKFQYGDWPATVDVTAIRQCTIPIGAAGLSDLTTQGTDATRVDGTIYVASIDIPGPSSRVVTLLSNLTGTTAPTTDKQLFAIYDSAPGTTTAQPIAWTALAGVAAATADIFFDQNLTTKAIIVPGRYFLALQMNGATTTIQMVAAANGYIGLVGNSRTGTFGTLANITVPTSLTTSAAPIMCIG